MYHKKLNNSNINRRYLCAGAGNPCVLGLIENEIELNASNRSCIIAFAKCIRLILEHLLCSTVKSVLKRRCLL